MKRYQLFIILFLLLSGVHGSTWAQNIEDLKLELKQSKSDTAKLELLNQIIELSQGEEKIEYANEALKLEDYLLGDQPTNQFILMQKAITLGEMAYSYKEKDMEEAKKLYYRALSVMSFLEETEDQSILKLNLLTSMSDLCEVDSIQYFASNAIDLAQVLLEKGLTKDTSMVIHNFGIATNNLAYYYDHVGSTRQALISYKKAGQIFESIDSEEFVALAYSNMSNCYVGLGEIDSALAVLNLAEEICVRNQDYQTLLPVYANYVTIFHELGDHLKAIDYTEQSLAIQKKLDASPRAIAHTYNSMAILHYFEGNYESSEIYLNKIFEMEDEISEDVLSTYYLNMSALKDKMGDSQKKYDALNRSIFYSRKQNLKVDLGKGLMKFAMYSVEDHQDFTTALVYLDSAMNLFKEAYNPKGVSDVSLEKAKIYLELNDIQKAQYYGEIAYREAEDIGFYMQLRDATELLAKVYKRQKKYDKALQMTENYYTLRDSLESVETKNELYKSKIDLEYSQKIYADSIESVKAQEITTLKINEKNAQIEKQQARNTLLIFGLVFLVLLIFFMIRAYAKKRELVSVIRSQKEIVEFKNKEITDSINYASKIQRAILTSDDYFNKVLNDFLVLYQPKDIVSGDFYWLYQVNSDLSILAVVDCTGHGVPGAFMSMIGNSLLNEIVIENQIRKSNEILDRLREGVIKSLSQSGGESNQRDGMDMALCIINHKLNTIEFSGANNGVWIVSSKDMSADIPSHKKSVLEQDGVKLIEIKGNKFPIGKHTGELKSFESFVYQLNKGDTFYLSTDGFADQFGGQNNKKFKYKRFKQLLLTLNSAQMDERKEKLIQAFEDWKGDNEQLDDVCVVGVRV